MNIILNEETLMWMYLIGVSGIALFLIFSMDIDKWLHHLDKKEDKDNG